MVPRGIERLERLSRGPSTFLGTQADMQISMSYHEFAQVGSVGPRAVPR